MDEEQDPRDEEIEELERLVRRTVWLQVRLFAKMRDGFDFEAWRSKRELLLSETQAAHLG